MKNLKISILYVLLACFFAACTTEQPKPKTVFEVLTQESVAFWSISSAKFNGVEITPNSPAAAAKPNSITFRKDNTYSLVFNAGTETGTFEVSAGAGYSNFDIMMSPKGGNRYTFNSGEQITANSLVIKYTVNSNIFNFRFLK